jgi:AraC family transcriptional regulator
VSQALHTKQWLHRKCVQQILGNIEKHIADEHDLRTLADFAGYSPFHFHRMFAHVTGETPGDCIRRLRLERAAISLTANRNLSVLDVSIDVGFQSQQAFAHAFQSRFGMCASEWRDGEFWWYNGRYWDWRDQERRRFLQSRGNGRVVGENHAYCLDTALPDAAEGKRPGCIAKLEIKELPAMRVAHLHSFGPMTEATWGALRGRLERWGAERSLITPDSVVIGGYYCNPTITPVTHLRYDLGLVVGTSAVMTPEMTVQDYPGGKYLVVDYDGPPSESNLWWEYVLSYWNPRNRIEVDPKRPRYTSVPLAQHTLPWTPDTQIIQPRELERPVRYRECLPVR